ncbi:MAG: type I methionyl aminopeptidase [Candidatus Omnitrophica bacterium]|nr:type I methionyl aminopeptidase [Candidatus Omnitrophota bacterium]
MILLKSERELELIRRACGIVRELLERLAGQIRPGIRTLDLDMKAYEIIKTRGGESAFKGYRGFPAHICTSVNEEVVHGIPGERRLEEGDIVGVDVGVRVEGYHGDAARTFAVGKIGKSAQLLIEVTRESLREGIGRFRAGGRLSDIGAAVQGYVEAHEFSVVREFVGHGIGRDLHEDPQVPNFGEPGTGPRLVEGMTLAIEPMVNMGKPDVRVLEDQWTVVTCDGMLSAHFEDTVALTERGTEVLTNA